MVDIATPQDFELERAEQRVKDYLDTIEKSKTNIKECRKLLAIGRRDVAHLRAALGLPAEEVTESPDEE